jgi:hypothetical protein
MPRQNSSRRTPYCLTRRDNLAGVLPEPMLSRPGPLPKGPRWTFEVKWDGFRAIVSTERDLRIRSRRGWNMTPALPELAKLPAGLVVDGEVVAFNDAGDPHFPLLARRVLNYDRSIRAHLIVFDLLRLDGEDMTVRRYRERRSILEALDLNGPHWTTPCAFDDGETLRAAVWERGLEGVVAKKTDERYWPGGSGGSSGRTLRTGDATARSSRCVGASSGGFPESHGAVSVAGLPMEGIIWIGPIQIERPQAARWKSGHLAPEWKKKFPELFDDDDLRLANSQSGNHFYEWLGAIVLHHTTGYLSLVEKYEFGRHRRKQDIVAQLLPTPVRDALNYRGQGYTQAPDLLMYAEDLSDWFFCEVKGPGDRLSDEQKRKFQVLADMTAKPVRLLKFNHRE